jgi:hypothetical protein
MLHRILFPLIALFWIVMNVLLWRAEFGEGRESGGSVDPAIVWQKILTAPDDSGLEVRWRGQRIGFCRWAASVGESVAPEKAVGGDYEPEGMVKRPTGYQIDFEGNVLAGEPVTRVRFSLRLQLAATHAWHGLNLRITARHRSWEVRTAEKEKKLTLTYDGDDAPFSRTFSFEELRNPRRLLEELAGPFDLMLPGPVAGLEPKPADLSLGLAWEASTDWLSVGHSRVRVYRLRAHLLDRYEVVVIVSRVGEILRVDLPRDGQLVNEALANW